MSREPPADYDDNPEWTEQTILRARPAGEVVPPHVLVALTRQKGGRPRGSTKTQISLRIDADVLEKFRATGRGWQSRMNEVLARAKL